MTVDIIAWGVDPQDHQDWPVRWASSQEDALMASRALLVSLRELAYYENGVKLFTASSCYESLKHGQHLFMESIVKRQNRYPANLLDPTAGWGRDALSVALLGINVTVMEKQTLPLCFLLYAKRYLYPRLSERFTIIPGCFSEHKFEPTEFACLYLDPLFFEQKKTVSKKAMTLLYHTEQTPDNENHLLVSGLDRLQPQTVIVKHPLKSELGALPHVLNHSRTSRSCRYDIFYVNQQKINYASLFS